MTDHGDPMRRTSRSPWPRRSRRRWTAAAGVAAAWVVLLVVTGSAIMATVTLVVIAGLCVAAVFGLRALGITRDHPWVQRMAARPWRDGQDVLQLALRHVSDVFVVTPSGTLLAPNVVDLRMNPEDLRSLGERMEPGLVMSSAAEVYEEQVVSRGARFARPDPAEVHIYADPSIPPGRYTLRQGQPVHGGAAPGGKFADSGPQVMPSGPELAAAQLAGAPLDAGRYDDGRYDAGQFHGRQYGGGGQAASQFGGPQPGGPQPSGPQLAEVIPHPASAGPDPADGGPDQADAGPRYQPFASQDGRTTAHPEPASGLTAGYGGRTIIERSQPHIPTLRLVTGSSVAETSMSGARAGRGAVEMALPNVPTVSREHARFTFSDGRWWVANLGMNGLTVNGEPAASEHPLSDGDTIRWGKRPEALLSRVEIG